MKTLPTDITSKGFHYKQVLREGNVAIYSQAGAPNGPIIAYEVIVVQSHNGYVAFGNEVPASEYYPRDEDWGKKGFTVSGYGDDNLHRAKVKMREVIAANEVKVSKRAKKENT